MHAPKSEGGSFEKHPVGPTALVCTRIVDTGTVFNQAKNVDQHKIMLGFESSILMASGEYKDQPFLVFSNFNYSMYKNSMLCQFIEAWQGITLTQEEADRYDISTLLGKPVFSNIVHNSDFVNMTSPMPMPVGMTAPKVVGKTILIDLQDLDQVEFAKLSDKQRMRIEGSKEYKANSNPKQPESENPAEFIDDKDITF